MGIDDILVEIDDKDFVMKIVKSKIYLMYGKDTGVEKFELIEEEIK